MRSYSEIAGIISGFQLTMFNLATNIVESIPDSIQGKELLRCHELARAVGKILGLEYVDGKYGPVDHSWLIVPYSRDSRFPVQEIRGRSCILDTYCVGRLPKVQLVVTDPILPHTSAYINGKMRDDILENIVNTIVDSIGQSDLLEGIRWSWRS